MATPRRANPEQGKYSVTSQMSKERFIAMQQAKQELGEAASSIALTNLGVKVGRVFPSVTQHEGRNVSGINRAKLEPGNVAVTVVTPVGAPRETFAFQQRTQQILEQGAAPQPETAPVAPQPVQNRGAAELPAIDWSAPLPPHGGYN